MRTLHLPATLLYILLLTGCGVSSKESSKHQNNQERALMTLDSIYAHYSAPDTWLLRENYPFDDQYRASYLATEENAPNQYAYLWPYSGTFSAVNAIYETSGNLCFKELLDKRVLPGLEEYYDVLRTPYGYASYINGAPESDRFYDDNVWLGIDFTDLYMMARESHYLEKAKIIWDFVISGTDEKLGGGIYWCEQKKGSKNTCSNAPGSVFAFKLFMATQDSTYFKAGQELYEWTKQHLQDSANYLYFDNVRLDGKIGKAKYAYNSGQMMQSAALQYKLTKDTKYLTEAQNIAKACYNYFFHDFTTADGETFRILNKGDVWFTAVMLRGFIELYHMDNDKTYMDAFNKNLDYAWNHARDEHGLFSVNFTGQNPDKKKWLLTQAAMVEMFARMGAIK